MWIICQERCFFKRRTMQTSLQRWAQKHKNWSRCPKVGIRGRYTCFLWWQEHIISNLVAENNPNLFSDVSRGQQSEIGMLAAPYPPQSLGERTLFFSGFHRSLPQVLGLWSFLSSSKGTISHLHLLVTSFSNSGPPASLIRIPVMAPPRWSRMLLPMARSLTTFVKDA